jgi:hypothetical protein
MSPQPDPINFGGAGDIDMFPAETHALLREIFDAGAIFADRWGRLASAIAADENEVGTGFDDLSTTFRTQYNALKPDLETLSNNVQPSFERMGTNGNDIVVRYLEMTQQQVDQMRSLE